MKKLIILFLLFYFFNNPAYSKETIIFSIDEEIYTSIDIENKINYLLLVKKIQKNSESSDNFFSEAKNNLIEEELLSKFIENRNITIAKQDIDQTYNNLVSYLANNKEENFLKLLDKYDLKLDYIYKQISKEISKQIVKQILLNYVEIEDNKINDLKYNELLEVRINNITLYKENISREEYEYQKKEIINQSQKNIEFKNKINNLIDNNFNISFYINKWININNIQENLKKLIYKTNEKEYLTFENNNLFYYFEVIEKKYPDINVYFTFIQINSNSKEKLKDLLNNKEICTNKFIQNINLENDYEAILYNDKNKKDLNKQVFSKLNKTKDNVLISSNNNNTLIYICDIKYNDDELKNYIIENHYKKEINILYKDLIKDLKIKFNFISY